MWVLWNFTDCTLTGTFELLFLCINKQLVLYLSLHPAFSLEHSQGTLWIVFIEAIALHESFSASLYTSCLLSPFLLEFSSCGQLQVLVSWLSQRLGGYNYIFILWSSSRRLHGIPSFNITRLQTCGEFWFMSLSYGAAKNIHKNNKCAPLPTKNASSKPSADTVSNYYWTENHTRSKMPRAKVELWGHQTGHPCLWNKQKLKT